MRIKDFLHIIILSFYSRNLYANVVNKWNHWGLGFLLRFSTLVAFIISILLFTIIAAADFKDLSPLLEQIPELKIENDQASLIDKTAKLPLKINPTNSNKEIIIIDLSITDAHKYQQNIVVFTKDRIAFNFTGAGDFSVSYHDLFQNNNIKIVNSTNLINLLEINQKKLLGIILILGVPIGSLLYFLVTLLKSILYAFPTSVLARILNYDLSFKQLTRLAIITNAPAVIIASLIMLLFWNMDTAIIQSIAGNIYLFYFVYWFISCGRKATKS